MNKLFSVLWNTTVYKAACICVFLLIPAYPFCIFPQPLSALLLVWGALILVQDLFTKRMFLRQAGSLFLALFCIGYAVTILLYAGEDKFSTFHLYCWTIVEFFVLFTIKEDKFVTMQTMFRDLHFINRVICVVTLVAGSLCMFCYFFKVSAIIPDLEGINGTWFLGVVTGRNSGIFNNPISCANAMFVGCVASLFNLVYPKKRTKGAIVCYVTNFTVCWLCINTTLTRTYVYGLYIFVFIASFVAIFQLCSRTCSKRLLQWGAAVCASLVLTAGIVGGTEIGKIVIRETAEQLPTLNAHTLLDVFFSDDFSSENGENDGPTIIVDENVNTGLIRDEIDRLPNFFYPRNEFWKIGLQVIPHSPVFGFTTGNMKATSLEYGDTPYFHENGGVGIVTYHNAYFDIAVSAGLLGLGLILSFLIFQIVRTLWVIFTKKFPATQNREILGYGVSVGYLATHICMTCMFLGVLCLTNVSVCMYFWIILGFVSQINDQILGNRRLLSCYNILHRFLKKQ
ncbi:MAG: O-antigen ligase family protein [Clostridia bacterium]|nr:O-antigen ligase family protein [Clostridia bacterium]